MPSKTAPALPPSTGSDDAPAVARKVGLRYVDDSQPGIGRKKTAAGFRYVGPDGKPVRDDDVKKRIGALAIPPAWTDVWICPLEHGHIPSSTVTTRNGAACATSPSTNAC
jgi:DNA topoisomerase I